jgi:hypothetical protein
VPLSSTACSLNRPLPCAALHSACLFRRPMTASTRQYYLPRERKEHKHQVLTICGNFLCSRFDCLQWIRCRCMKFAVTRENVLSSFFPVATALFLFKVATTVVVTLDTVYRVIVARLFVFCCRGTLRRRTAWSRSSHCQ